MRFLLIEDNPDLGSAVRDRLALDGHAVDWANTLDVAGAFLDGAEYDLVLLDIMLPDGDGRAFLRSRLRSGMRTPVIVLTARSQISDRVDMLDMGADDYITKPFDFAELEARCRAVLRRRGGSAQNRIAFGDIELDPLSASLHIGGVTKELRNRELRLLEIFLSMPGRIFSKAALVDRLFSYDEDVSENAIEVYVGRLRKKLEGARVRIETARGIGYRIAE